jgi:predicted metal-dependent enzyme (double-stranded beta helix superfamily)
MDQSGQRFEQFCRDVEHIVASHGEESVVAREQAVVAEVKVALEGLLADDSFALDPSVTVAHPERYVMYPLFVHPDGLFSVAAAVWNVGQQTPVHGHETWGVVGIYDGVEHETSYRKPAIPDVPLMALDSASWTPGQVTICCTTDDDVHHVACEGDKPCIGIHVYGADIGTLRRRAYDPETGAVRWFVSEWAEPVLG